MHVIIRGQSVICFQHITHTNLTDWIELSSVLRPRQHNIGYMGDGFYRSKDPTNVVSKYWRNK